MSFICDGKFIADQIAEIGQDVILRAVTETVSDAVSKWGDSSETTVDTTIKAVVRQVTQEEQDEPDSVFQSGDVILSVAGKHDALIRLGNRVVYRNEEYEIDRIFRNDPGGIIYSLDAIIKKV